MTPYFPPLSSNSCLRSSIIRSRSSAAASKLRSAAALRISGMQVVRHNVFDFLGLCTKQFDLVFADPPYALEGLATLPAKVLGAGFLADDGLFILEHPADYNFSEEPGFVKEKKYGNVHFSFFKKIFA